MGGGGGGVRIHGHVLTMVDHGLTMILWQGLCTSAGFNHEDSSGFFVVLRPMRRWMEIVNVYMIMGESFEDYSWIQEFKAKMLNSADNTCYNFSDFVSVYLKVFDHLAWIFNILENLDER